jgi:hypothetical protein
VSKRVVVCFFIFPETTGPIASILGVNVHFLLIESTPQK